MTVPISGTFNMFPLSNSTSIQGSVDAGGGTVPDNSNFDTIIAQSTPSLFHPTYAGTITALSQISSSLQYRGYPHIVNSINLKYSNSSAAAACIAQPSTKYVNSTPVRFDQASVVWTNSAGTTLANAGWYSANNISRYWNGSSFTTTVNCTGGGNVVYRYYIVGTGRQKNQFNSSWCASGGIGVGENISTSVYNTVGSNIAGTTDNVWYNSAAGTTVFSGNGYWYAISLSPNQTTNATPYTNSRQYTQIDSSGNALDAGEWQCAGTVTPY